MKSKLNFHFLTLFPEVVECYADASIIGRAKEDGVIGVNAVNIRDFAKDKHRTVDDTPYGGGVGMVMKVDIMYAAWKSIRKTKKSKTILLSAKGKPFTQAMARSWAKNTNQLIFISGRYEGVDDRVTAFVDEEVRVGDFVVTGGELPSLMMMDAVARHVPGVLGRGASADDESHATPGYLEYPQYTRPEIWEPTIKGKKKMLRVPPILLSGDHKAIEEWREKNAKH